MTRISMPTNAPRARATRGSAQRQEEQRSDESVCLNLLKIEIHPFYSINSNDLKISLKVILA